MDDKKKTKAQLIAELEELREHENTTGVKSNKLMDDEEILINNIQAAVIIHDSNAEIISCNNEAEKVLGVTRIQMLGTKTVKPEWEFIDEDGNIIPVEKYPVNQVLSTKQPVVNLVFSIHKKNNEIQWVYISANPIFDSEGEIFRIVVTFMDITERKKAEETLQSKKDELQLILDSSTVMIFYKDREGRFILANEALAQALGKPKEEIEGRLLSELLPKDQAEQMDADDREVMESEKPKIGIIETYESPEGTRWSRTSKVPLKDDKGDIIGIVGFGEDVTEWKKAEEALRDKNELNLALFEYNPIETIAVDTEGIITNFNLAKKKSGYRLPAIGDVMYKDYACRHEIDMYTELIECIRTGKSKEFPGKKYGDRFLTINIAPFPHGAVITSQDITERKVAAESLKASQSELQKQKLALEQKTIALREIIGEIEKEKNIIKYDITTNVKDVLLPILERLELKETSNKYIDLLKHHLKKLTSSFSRKITTKSINLTPREIQICTMVESGLTNKEISTLLSISCHTVEKHRNNIRIKFNITKKNINLSSFLQQL